MLHSTSQAPVAPSDTTAQPSMTEVAQASQVLMPLKKVTALGGGHGLGRLMATLSFLKNRLVGVVATTDNGGSTGLLRQSHQCIAWGDIRNCLSQLATQPLAAELLNYRFKENSPLQGHNFGNLLLHALDEVSPRPLDGIQLLSRLMRVNSRVLPMSETPTDLLAETSDNIRCFGELRVDAMTTMPAHLSLSPQVSATPEVIEHIYASELIVLGPGSLLTSVMPPLLVHDIQQAVAQSSAAIIFIDNLVAEQSPAGRISCEQRIQWVEKHLGGSKINAVISNHICSPLEIPVFKAKADTHIPHRHCESSLLVAVAQAVKHIRA